MLQKTSKKKAKRAKRSLVLARYSRDYYAIYKFAWRNGYLVWEQTEIVNHINAIADVPEEQRDELLKRYAAERDLAYASPCEPFYANHNVLARHLHCISFTEEQLSRTTKRIRVELTKIKLKG